MINCFYCFLLLNSILFLIPHESYLTSKVTVATNVFAINQNNLTVDFSTFLGGKDIDRGYSIAATDKGECYITGRTESSDFPMKNAFDETLSGESDAFIAKFATDGSLLWSSYLGGSNRDRAFAIAIVDDGSCFVLGNTNSSDFPVKNAYNDTFSGYEDLFVSKFSSDGVLLWGTFLGGSDYDRGTGISVTKDGCCFVTGRTVSTNFPVKNAYESIHKGSYDIFVSKFNVNGNLLWSTLFGGYGFDSAEDITVVEDGCCFVTGSTNSEDFPIQNAFDSSYNGNLDGFVTKFDAQGMLLWSTFLGGSDWDDSLGIAVTGDGSCYVSGYTGSFDFPTKNAFNSTLNDWGSAFVSKLSSKGTLLWSTFLGGDGIDRSYAITSTFDGSCYVVGYTDSPDFPIKNAYAYSKNDGFDVFITKFSSEGLMQWSSYLGGSKTDKGFDIAVTEYGMCFVTGYTRSPDFPRHRSVDNLFAISECFITKFIDPHPPSQLRYYNYLFVLPAIMSIMLIIVIILYAKRNTTLLK